MPSIRQASAQTFLTIHKLKDFCSVRLPGVATELALQGPHEEAHLSQRPGRGGGRPQEKTKGT